MLSASLDDERLDALSCQAPKLGHSAAGRGDQDRDELAILPYFPLLIRYTATVHFLGCSLEED
jgi:hypothetical protein